MGTLNFLVILVISNSCSCIDRFQVDFWKEPNHIGDFADIMISSKFALAMEHRFRRANMTYDIRVPDVEKWAVLLFR